MIQKFSWEKYSIWIYIGIFQTNLIGNVRKEKSQGSEIQNYSWKDREKHEILEAESLFPLTQFRNILIW